MRFDAMMNHSGHAPMMVLLPGLDGTGKLLGDFVRQLSSRIDTQIIPYPTDRPLGYRELESHVRERLPQNRPFFLLAESFSGPIAIRIAAYRPDALLGVVLVGSFAKNPYPLWAWAGPLLARLPLKSLPRWVRAPLMWGSRSPSQAPPKLERAIAGVSAAVIRRRIRAVFEVDETNALSQITLPILTIHAGHDRVIPKAAGLHLLRGLPGATHVEIAGPHLLLQTQPAECAEQVVRFIQSVESIRGRANHPSTGSQ